MMATVNSGQTDDIAVYTDCFSRCKQPDTIDLRTLISLFFIFSVLSVHCCRV